MPADPCDTLNVLRSPLKMFALAFALTFLIVTVVLVAIMASKQNSCFIATQADPLGGLPSPAIPNLCASEFHRHIAESVLFSGLVALLVASGAATWSRERVSRWDAADRVSV